jgi:hypothetical protein
MTLYCVAVSRQDSRRGRGGGGEQKEEGERGGGTEGPVQAGQRVPLVARGLRRAHVT